MHLLLRFFTPGFQFSGKTHIDPFSFFGKQSCHRESVSTVVAGAAYHQCIGQINLLFFHCSHTLKRRTFHQYQRRNPDLMDHSSVRRFHLFSRQYIFHILTFQYAIKSPAAGTLLSLRRFRQNVCNTFCRIMNYLYVPYYNVLYCMKVSSDSPINARSQQ